MKVCADNACSTELLEADGFRVVPNAEDSTQFSIEIDKNIAHVPETTFYLQVNSFSVTIYESFTVYIKDCSINVISLAGDAVAPINREIGKNQGIIDLFSST